MKFELRTLAFIDSLQPQLAQYIAKDNRVYDPKEYDSALFLEIAPAMEIHAMIDMALKATKVSLGSVVTERQFGLLQVHHADQGEVKESGRAILKATGLKENDRAQIQVMTNKIIRSVEQDHAISFTGASRGNMVLAGESVYIIETVPAAYLALVCNEALKASRVKLVNIFPTGATGRLILSGPEDEIDAAEDAANKCIEQLNSAKTAGKEYQLV